jgi:hypothetical protein
MLQRCCRKRREEAPVGRRRAWLTAGRADMTDSSGPDELMQIELRFPQRVRGVPERKLMIHEGKYHNGIREMHHVREDESKREEQ